MNLPADGQRVSIARARQLSHVVGLLLWWRPEPDLPEEKQYCLVYYAREDQL